MMDQQTLEQIGFITGNFKDTEQNLGVVVAEIHPQQIFQGLGFAKLMDVF